MHDMVVKPHDKGTFLVSSQTGNGDFYLVDLLDDARPYGRCTCTDFLIRVDAPLNHGNTPEKFQCKHVKTVIKFLLT
ncbi:MAG: hypothetical protein D4R57_01155 [Verrucomicrobiales bacterium]|nr:MAG: hypothetical protein D4R57_01155 [Verrucomicrobiales bacterium]